MRVRHTDFDIIRCDVILTVNDDLYIIIEDIYDFDDKSINLDFILKKGHVINTTLLIVQSAGLEPAPKQYGLDP